MQIANPESEVIAEYQEILNKNSIFDKIKHIEIKMPDLTGENFGSTCEYVTIRFENSEAPNLELFLKKQLENSVQGDMIAEMQLFRKESGIYNHLHKDLQAFLQANAKSGSICKLDFIPKCFYADSKAILLENIIKRNYILLNKRDRQDLKTAKMVLQHLAVYHAASYSMISEIGKEDFQSKYNCCLEEALYTETAPVSVKAIFETAVANSIQFIETAEEFPNKSKILEKMSEYTNGRAFEEACKVGDAQASNIFIVANHGDCWNNNILFHRNKETGEFDHLVFVDYQLSRIGSPNMDLNHYLYSSVKPHIRRKHLKELLEIYFETLQRIVTQELDAPFPHLFDDFYEDFVQKSPIGFWIFMCMNTVFNIMGDSTYTEFGLRRWIEENPDRVRKTTGELIDLIEEHFYRLKITL